MRRYLILPILAILIIASIDKPITLGMGVMITGFLGFMGILIRIERSE